MRRRLDEFPFQRTKIKSLKNKFSASWPEMDFERFAGGAVLQAPTRGPQGFQLPLARRRPALQYLRDPQPNQPAGRIPPSGKAPALGTELNLPTPIVPLRQNDGKRRFNELNHGSAIRMRSNDHFPGNVGTVPAWFPNRLPLANRPAWLAQIRRRQRPDRLTACQDQDEAEHESTAGDCPHDEAD